VYDIQADENIRLIHDSLADAVEDCIDAAGQEYDIAQQRTLLRAAAYGRAFCRFSLLFLIFSVQLTCGYVSLFPYSALQTECGEVQ
jgi:hypothetical protein